MATCRYSQRSVHRVGYEEGLSSADYALKIRQTIAYQHYIGNTDYSTKDAVSDIVGLNASRSAV